jgi:hypothetical protein
VAPVEARRRHLEVLGCGRRILFVAD